jgi:ABC transport system ATP-binding/permease protein
VHPSNAISVSLPATLLAMGALMLACANPSSGGVAGSDAGAAPSTTAASATPDAQIFAAAREKFAAKDYAGAHGALRAIPEGAPARDDPAFKEIEAAWADWMFDKAGAAADDADKKRHFKEILATPSVDAERRKKAASMIAELEAKAPLPPSPSSSPSAAPLSQLSPPPPDPTFKPLFHDQETPSPAGAPGGPHPPILQGPSGEDAQRRLLEPKVWSGKATVEEIRLLKAICSHLGKRECKDRAAAMLKQKLEKQQP